MSKELVWLKADRRTKAFKLFDQWLPSVPSQRNKFLEFDPDEDPFLYNETASVGLLAGAASQAGLIALNEYFAYKRRPGRGRPKFIGRCDLWIAQPREHMSVAFEFKQKWSDATIGPIVLGNSLFQACEAASELDPREADHKIGALIISAIRPHTRDEILEPSVRSLLAYVDYACKIGGGCVSVWLLMKDLADGSWGSLRRTT